MCVALVTHLHTKMFRLYTTFHCKAHLSPVFILPPSFSFSYASTFEENRIGKDMLLDLDKVSCIYNSTHVQISVSLAWNAENPPSSGVEFHTPYSVNCDNVCVCVCVYRRYWLTWGSKLWVMSSEY